MSLEEVLKPKEEPVVEEITQPVPALETPEYRVFSESMSEDIGELAGALALAQGAMSNGAKAKQGYGYKYMELGALIDIARPALSKVGIAIIQTHELLKGKAPSVVTHTTIMHKSNQWHKSSIELPIKVMPQLSQAQMIGVNCTYGRRYSLQAVCLIASEDDTDGTVKK
jgi:hypothetical protein